MLRDASRVVNQAAAQQQAAAAAAAAAVAATRQQQRPAPLRSLGLAVVFCLRCRACVCAVSVCVHPGCPSLPWLRGFGLGIKLGACRPIVWTAGARMNLERSSVQIVHSSGMFRAVFCQVRSIWFLRVDFFTDFGLEKNYRKHTNRKKKNTEKKSAPPKTHHEIHSGPATASNSRRHARKHVPRVSPYSPASIDPGLWKSASYSSRTQ